MSIIEQIIVEAKANNILLYIKDGQLAFIAEQGSFPGDLKARISAHNKEIVNSLLSMHAASVHPETAPFSLLTEEERRIVGEDCEDAYPLSALQAGMTFHVQLERFSGVYHDIMANHVKIPWNQEYFEQALAACIHEQPILLSGFRLDGDRPFQEVHAKVDLPLKVE